MAYKEMVDEFMVEERRSEYNASQVFEILDEVESTSKTTRDEAIKKAKEYLNLKTL